MNEDYNLRKIIYLEKDKHSAMLEWLTDRYGIEVPQSYTVPIAECLPDTCEGKPPHDCRYFKDGGIDWPERVVVYNSMMEARK